MGKKIYPNIRISNFVIQQKKYVLNWLRPFEKLIDSYRDLDVKAQRIIRWMMRAFVAILFALGMHILSLAYHNLASPKIIYKTDTVEIPLIVKDTTNNQSIVGGDRSTNTQYNTNIGKAEKVYQ